MAVSQIQPVLSSEADLVDRITARAREAQAGFERGADQARYDQAALAVGWALMEPGRNAELAELAVATTGLGNVADKIAKNHRKTLGLLRDLRGAATCGVIAEHPDKGLTEIARAKGVIGAVVPSTNPVATPANNAINALKCGNAIILAPSPAGVVVCERLLAYVHAELDKVGLERDLVQMIPAPASKVRTQRLMETVDLVVVTGSKDNVRRAYSSGTPAIGVGVGNVAVIVDETADIAAAARKIVASKSFDNATSCSSENALIVVDSVFDAFLREFHAAGGRYLTGAEGDALKAALFKPAGLSRDLLAKDIEHVIEKAGVAPADAGSARILLVEGKGVGPEHPESGEKLSLVATLYRARDFEHAKAIGAQLLSHVGAGHSIGLHSARDDRARALGLELPTCRVIVNQAHCFATGGSFDNGLPFSLSMGCGSWGGNSIDDNLNYRHFMNITKIVRTIAPVEPAEGEIFGDYWQVAGK